MQGLAVAVFEDQSSLMLVMAGLQLSDAHDRDFYLFRRDQLKVVGVQERSDEIAAFREGDTASGRNSQLC